MADNRILIANFRLSRRVKTASLYQYDYGQVLRFLGICLPDVYEVHFSGSESGGTAYTVLGNADGVMIPDALLATGNPIHAWIFLHDAQTDGETEYKVEIPVIRRPKVTDAEPTPVQQDVITQAIAALNEGVSTVEEAVAGVGEAIDTALQEAKDSGEFDGKDGYTPVKGVDYFDGKDGKDGEPGKDGETGPAGISPTVTVTDIEGGHRVTITDADGPHSIDVMNGESGGAVQDVQVNGVSVLDAQGVANVPFAANGGVPGVIRVSSSYGHSIVSGVLTHKPAGTATIKNGRNTADPIVSSNQHESAFYGLAKAAGYDEKNSTLPVGQYTESAKSAIKSMIGVGETVTLREWAELGEDMDLIEIPLPEKYSRIFVRFMTRINNSDNNLANGNVQSLIWLGDDTTFGLEQQDRCVYSSVYIRASDTFMVKARFDVAFPYLERYCTPSYGATNWSANATWQSTGGSYSYSDKLTTYPRLLCIRPYDTTKGYLYKANSKLCVYAVL